MSSSLSKKLSHRILLIFLSTFLAIISLEAYLRFKEYRFKQQRTEWSHQPSRYIADDKLIWTYRDPFYFWDDPQVKPKPGKQRDTTRIFALGDSFTQAHVDVPANGTFYRLLGAELGESHEFFHFGVSGYSHFQYLELLKRYGSLYQPDIILIQSYLGNDIGENSGLIIHKLNALSRIETKNSNKNSSLIPSLSKKNFFDSFHLFHWLSETSQKVAFNLRGFPFPGDVLRVLKSLERSSHILSLFSIEKHESIEKAWQKTFSIIKEIKAQSDQFKSKLIFITIPHELQVHDKLWKEVIRSYNLNESQFDRLQPTNRLTQFLKDNQISHTDLSSSFRSHIQSGTAIYQGHLTKRGHQAVKERLISSLNNR